MIRVPFRIGATANTPLPCTFERRTLMRGELTIFAPPRRTSSFWFAGTFLRDDFADLRLLTFGMAHTATGALMDG